jgi:protein arginine kinase activator
MMQCTVCHKTLATIHVLDLEDGSVIDEQSLCPTCAESAGYVHPKAAPLKISPEMLEDLIGGMKSTGSTTEIPETADACPACGLTSAQFRSRGRLGCPRCYEMFRTSLLPLLERVHDGTSHRGRCPRKSARMAGEDDRLAELRSSLQDAITAENYELAADLRDQIQELSPGEETSS